MSLAGRINPDWASLAAGATLVGALAVLPAVTASAQSTEEHTLRVFPRRPLFAPLSADPRWPRIGVAYMYYFRNSQFAHVGAADAGASIPVVQKKGRRTGAWEVGIQGGIFAIFDFGAPSSDLVNADYLGGVTFSYAFDSLVLMTRIIHQSSHLGDEYLLNNEVDRINLSFEKLEVLVSYDVRPWARVYGGPGVLLRRDPSYLERWSFQAGGEVRPFTASTKRPLQVLIAANLNLWQETEWIPDVSVVAGATLDPNGDSSYRVDFLLRYYVGRSPNGQFFTERIQTLGPAVQLYF
ncbi:MAG: DUF1207 domain-containing protein [Myxococcales bacterium]|jgi:hypothetical protein